MTNIADISLHTPPYEATIGFNGSLHQGHALSEYKISYHTILRPHTVCAEYSVFEKGIQHHGSSNGHALGRLQLSLPHTGAYVRTTYSQQINKKCTYRGQNFCPNSFLLLKPHHELMTFVGLPLEVV